MKEPLNIRPATEADAASLLSIYAPYVERTAITFEYDVPTIDEFRERITHTLKQYPYLVAERHGRILGYAYAGMFKEREAYRHCVETSIYVAQEAQGQGIGRRLLRRLEEELGERGFININACIAWVETPNGHLSHQSAIFHEKMGYRRVAHFHRCGYKFGEWYDMIWMEKLLDESFHRQYSDESRH
ncbi:MAG: GNAT family N-acetyltransferase [Prevotella sp.]